MTRPAHSVQLYSVRNELEKDMAKTLARLAEIGFTAVEPFGLPEKTQELKVQLLAAGLNSPTAHASVLENPELAFSAAVELGVSILFEPYQPESFFQNKSELVRLADKLAAAAQVGNTLGIKLGYHNHAHEIENLIGGVPAIVALAAETPESIVFEVDLFWCSSAKANPVDILNALGGRVEALHVKDAPFGMGVESQVPAGEGDVPVLESLRAAKNARAILEFDDYDKDLFDALATGLAFLNENAVEK
jgi:sugar phosphate isomerase/epimerase